MSRLGIAASMQAVPTPSRLAHDAETVPAWPSSSAPPPSSDAVTVRKMAAAAPIASEHEEDGRDCGRAWALAAAGPTEDSRSILEEGKERVPFFGRERDEWLRGFVAGAREMLGGGAS